MNAQQILKAAHEALSDHGENPRSELMRSLSALVDASGDVPTGEIQLRAMLAPGGAHEVTDQHGRRVAGVKSVAVFEDGSGNSVFQVNL